MNSCRYCDKESEGTRWEHVCRDCRSEIQKAMDDPIDFDSGVRSFAALCLWPIFGALLWFVFVCLL